MQDYSGIINEGNMCFLNSVISCLSNLLDLNQEPKCQFGEYLIRTLKYVRQPKLTKNLYLFILELRKIYPHLFDAQFERQQAQDAFEILQYLIESAQLGSQIQCLYSVENEELLHVPRNNKKIYMVHDWSFSQICYIGYDDELILPSIEEFHQNDFLLYRQDRGKISTELVDGKQHKYDFENWTYYCERAPFKGKSCISVQLQYIDNDQIRDIQPPRFVHFDKKLTLGDLSWMVRQKLKKPIWFDVISEGRVLYSNHEDLSSVIQVQCMLRSRDLEEFVFCKGLEEEKGGLNLHFLGEPPKELKLGQASRHLALQIDRFVYENNDYLKNSRPYKIHETLEAKVDGKSHKYKLESICCHTGFLMMGHYTSVLRGCKEKEWKYYDDERVYTTELDYQIYKDAYILFYTCVDM